ncbi:MAG: hypothetical protein ABFS18_02245 [Thermodesulfobacteriota bacterium]
MNQVEIRKIQKGDIPISRNTAYKWHSEKKHPNLVYKVAGILIFDLDEWEKMSQKAKKENVKNATSFRQLEA